MFIDLGELVLLLATLYWQLWRYLHYASKWNFVSDRRDISGEDVSAQSHTSSLPAALLGLIALLFVFTFLIAIGRFEGRKTAPAALLRLATVLPASAQYHWGNFA